MNYILGISSYYHDSAAALIKDGEILAAAQEERFSRIKNDSSFPSQAIQYCLDFANINENQISAVIFYDKPFLTFERILESCMAIAPMGFKSFSLSMPTWIKDKLFLKSKIKKDLSSVFGRKYQKQIFFSEHHLSHAASTFFPSPYEESAILTLDGVGEWATTGIFRGEGNKIKKIKEIRFPHSLGLFYSSFTYFLGFKVNSGEYKMMGLAPYANPQSEQTKKFQKIIEEHLISFHKDGSYQLNLDYFNFLTSDRMIKEEKWEKLFGIKKRIPETELNIEQANLAWAAQTTLEKGILNLATAAKKATGSQNLVLAGGVALNCVANGNLKRSDLFKNIWIQPAADDAGGALGAALAYYHIGLNEPRISDGFEDKMKGSYLGPSFTNEEIIKELNNYNLSSEFFPDEQLFLSKVAHFLEMGLVVGWFQGRLEWGPRALGHRSILANPSAPEMQKKLNLKIKFREGFRPFAPIVLEEDTEKFFEFKGNSPYMLFTAQVSKSMQKNQPIEYINWDFGKKLKFERSSINAITHVDYSARLQTVSKKTNLKLWNLLHVYKNKTGSSVLVNTSFNVRGEPIVCSPKDAINCFLKTEMDVLAIGSYIIKKRDLD
jgi:carbamoyltransferase